MKNEFDLASLFQRNPRLTALTIGLVAVAGLAALTGLPRQEDPSLSRRMGTITATYPGASALRVESQVTEKIEDELQDLHEIDHVESTSRTGIAVVRVDLKDRYTDADVDEIWSKVRDRVADAHARMPAEVPLPTVEDRTSKAVTVMASLRWRGEGEPQLDLLSRIADDLEQRLANLPGTKETEIFGEADPEIRVTLDADRIAALGLAPGTVASAIREADTRLPSGRLRHERNDLLLEVAGTLDSIERVGEIPVVQGADGRIVRVADVARVEKTVADPPATLALISGERGVVVTATMEDGDRVDRWAAVARAEIDDFAAGLPQRIQLDLIFDQSTYTEARLSTFAVNLLLGGALVILILFVTMGARSAFCVGLTLPITVALVLTELMVMGVPLHQMSIIGLIIALGLLIDNAIVVVDDYRAELRAGRSPRDAVSHAIRRLFVPLLASTTTTVLSFLPIALMPGGGGEFVGPIAISVALAVSSSFVVAMTLIPAVTSWVVRQDAGDDDARWWQSGFSDERLTRVYRRSLGFALARPWAGIGLALVLPAIGFYAVTTLPEQFFPPNDRNQFQLQLSLPAQASVTQTQALVERARALVNAHPEVVESHWFIGESAPRVYYNMFALREGVAGYAGGIVTTRSATETEALLPGLQRELMAALPEATVLALPFEQGPPFTAPIEVRVSGPELEVLDELGEELRRLMAETDGVTYSEAELGTAQPKLLLRADEDEARVAGLTLGAVAREMGAQLDGAALATITEATEEIPVRVRAPDAVRSDLGRIADQRVVGTRPRAVTAEGVPGVPLSSLGRLDLMPEVSVIPRRDGRRVNTARAYLEPYTLIAVSLADFERRLAASGFELPPGYEIELGGESEQRGEAVGNLMLFAVPLLLTMAGTIILSFNSFRFAGIIGVVAIASCGLAFLGVWAFGYPMGFLAVVGTMGLVGLAINGGIIVLSALRDDEAAMAGDLDASVDVVVGATRHIVSTTLTTIGGFLPLILWGGRFWPPMATAIAGGVGGAALLSLYLVPTFFVLLRARARRRALAASDAAGCDLEHAVIPAEARAA